MKVGLVTELRETLHIRDQMKTREFEMTDVRHVARLGAVRRPGEYDIKYGNYTYCMEGFDVEGRPLHIIFVPGREHVKLITGIRPRPERGTVVRP
jgi:hypothetical protein